MKQDHGLVSHDFLVTVRPYNIFVPLHNEAFSYNIEKDVKVGTAVFLNEKQAEISHYNCVHNKANEGCGNGQPQIEYLKRRVVTC